jgi:hypothetical protein
MVLQHNSLVSFRNYKEDKGCRGNANVKEKSQCIIWRLFQEARLNFQEGKNYFFDFDE